MITLKGEFSFEEFALSSLEMIKKIKLVMKIMAFSFLLLLIILFVLDIFCTGYDILFGILMFIFLFAEFMDLYFLYEFTLKRIKKKFLKINPFLADGLIYEFTFGENEISIYEKTSSTEAKEIKTYDKIKKVKMNKDYIFLYINKFNAYPLKTATASEEDLMNLEKLLRSKVRKFKKETK